MFVPFRSSFAQFESDDCGKVVVSSAARCSGLGARTKKQKGGLALSLLVDLPDRVMFSYQIVCSSFPPRLRALLAQGITVRLQTRDKTACLQNQQSTRL